MIAHDLDTFGRPDSTNLGSTEGQGIPWLLEDGGGDLPADLGVEGGRARNYAGGPFDLSVGYASVDVGWSDGVVATTWSHADQGFAFPTFRYVDPDNYWSLTIDDGGSGFVILARTIGGIGSTPGALSGAPVEGGVYAIRGVGDQVEVLLDGASIIGPVTSSAHLTATRVGFGIVWPRSLPDWEWTAIGSDVEPPPVAAQRWPLRQRRRKR